MPRTYIDADTDCETTATLWVQVARIFHLDWLRYGDRCSRAARDQALSNARYALPPRDLIDQAKRLAEQTGRDWCDCGAYEREMFLDFARNPVRLHPAIDTTSSASRQHYIDTGRYLLIGEAEETCK
jgi:hypothetical protein